MVNNMPEPLGILLKEYPFVREVVIGKNIGLGSAVNRGVEKARGETLLFLNPDTRILFADTLDRLESRVQKKNGIVAARLIGMNYAQEPWGGGKKTTLGRMAKKRLPFLRGDTVPKSNNLVSVDWVSGAVFCIQKSDFLRVGGFDEDFFLYFEDMDFCVRLKKAKKNIYYDGSLPILHYGGESFSHRGEQKKHYFISQKIYFKKHRPAWENSVLHWLHKIFF